ncbi:MAG: hypothetical protein ACTHOU_10965 [Aureliella sp.]
MDARTCRPTMGLAALCATLIFVFPNDVQAQYGRPAAYGPQPGMAISPAMQPPTLQGMIPGGPAMGGRVRGGGASQGAGQGPNFIVLCNDPGLADTVVQEAEKLRRELAVHWLGQELPNWSRRCPIHVTAGPSLGAGGETRFALYNGNVGDWNMSVQGTPERILDSVLPHEITHTILASHFAPLNTHVPRWADEGACTTVEHSSEQNKHKSHLVQYLSTGRGLAFNRMFSLKDYPNDILPLYAQGHSVVEFLIAQGGPRKFVEFLEDGMQSQSWEAAVKRAYSYETLGQLQTKWNLWVAEGRGPVEPYAGNPAAVQAAATLASSSAPADAPSSEVASLDLNTPSSVPLDSASLAMAAEAAAPAAPASVDRAAALEEGASVALANHVAGANDAAVTKISSQTAGSAALGNVALGQAPTSNAAAASAASAAGDGFYRQRLESRLRDIERVAPESVSATTSASATAAAPAAVGAQPAARTASLDRPQPAAPIGGGARATSRPQPAQPTPTRVLDAGNLARPDQGAIYR